MNYGDTVGSRRKIVTWSSEIRQLQANLKLNPFQKKVLIGTLLGDGCLVPNAHKKNFRLKVEQQVGQRDYVMWKYLIFRDWCLSKPKYLKTNQSFTFRTISHPDFTVWYKLFYRRGKKILPQNIQLFLNSPLILAIWFMDDGAQGPGGRGLTLNTQCFTRKEHEILQECLWKNFQITTTLHKDRHNWRIYMRPSSAQLFERLVKDWIRPEFRYKFPSF